MKTNATLSTLLAALLVAFASAVVAPDILVADPDESVVAPDILTADPDENVIAPDILTADQYARKAYEASGTAREAGEYILEGFDTSGIPRGLRLRLARDLNLCGSTSPCGRRQFRQCVSRALYRYGVPEDLTGAEKRWIRRLARQYADEYYAYESSC
jgi:hypothetical protein